MGIFSSKGSDHGNDPDKPWEVSEKEAKKIKAENDAAAAKKAAAKKER